MVGGVKWSWTARGVHLSFPRDGDYNRGHRCSGSAIVIVEFPLCPLPAVDPAVTTSQSVDVRIRHKAVATVGKPSPPALSRALRPSPATSGLAAPTPPSPLSWILRIHLTAQSLLVVSLTIGATSALLLFLLLKVLVGLHRPCNR